MKNKNALVVTVNRFMLRTTVILALFFILTGIVTVRQRAQETKGEGSFSYAVFVDNDSEIGVKIGGRFLTVNKQTVREVEHYIKRFKTLMSRYG